MRYHDLRHYYASVLLSAGVSVKAVQEHLGHASATVTLDAYGHLMPDDADRSRQAVERAFTAPDRSAAEIEVRTR